MYVSADYDPTITKTYRKEGMKEYESNVGKEKGRKNEAISPDQ